MVFPHISYSLPTFLSGFPFGVLNFPFPAELSSFHSIRICFGKFYLKSICLAQHQGRDTNRSFLLSFSLKRNIFGNKLLNMNSTCPYYLRRKDIPLSKKRKTGCHCTLQPVTPHKNIQITDTPSMRLVSPVHFSQQTYKGTPYYFSL